MDETVRRIRNPRAVVLIIEGSLYLAGEVLKANGQLPD